jgi:hypothetical protein
MIRISKFNISYLIKSKKMKRLLYVLLFSVLSFGNVTGQNWDQIIKAVASDRAAADYFGYSVSISGDYAIVGAYHENHNASGIDSIRWAGSAYIFHYNGRTWAEQQKIVASDRTAYDIFGYSVSISGDYVIVGAYLEDHDASGINSSQVPVQPTFLSAVELHGHNSKRSFPPIARPVIILVILFP